MTGCCGPHVTPTHQRIFNSTTGLLSPFRAFMSLIFINIFKTNIGMTGCCGPHVTPTHQPAKSNFVSTDCQTFHS